MPFIISQLCRGQKSEKKKKKKKTEMDITHFHTFICNISADTKYHIFVCNIVSAIVLHFRM